MKNVNYVKFILLSLLLMTASYGRSQTTINGLVIDDVTERPLSDVSVSLLGKLVGAVTDQDGRFTLTVNSPQPVTIVVSAVGYARVVQEAGTTPVIRLQATNSVLQEYVITASRVEETVMQSPVTVEKLDLPSIKSSASVGFYEQLQNLKGVEMVTIGITNRQVNTRGFTLPGNSRFLQLVDGVDNQTPGISMSIGNLFGPNEVDIESIEVIPGAASALYGPIAFNGILLMKTKDPYLHQGLSVQVKTGLNHMNDSYSMIKPFNDLNIRYAKAFGKFAFKVNAAGFRAEEWYAVNYTDVDIQTPAANRGADNPARNGLNLYGDEVVRDLPGIGRISRTPYQDMDLIDNGVYWLKLTTALHYRINENLEASYQYNFGRGRAVNTGSSRFLLDNFIQQQHRAEIKGKQFFLRSYWTGERSGDTYNVRKLAQDINMTWVQDLSGQRVPSEKATDTWFMRYSEAFSGRINGVPSSNHYTARGFADQGRLLPGQPGFEQERERLIHVYGAKGAGVFTQSSFIHIEGQYDFSSLIKEFQLQAGGNFRRYRLFSNGTLFDDLKGKISINEYGYFLQAGRSLWDEKIKILSSLRLDKNENFKAHVTPRVSAVVQLAQRHFFRTSFQTGFRNPVPVDQFIKLNNGSLTVLGGVPANSRDMLVFENSYSYASVIEFNQEVRNQLQQGLSTEEAITRASLLLKRSTVDYIKPERVRTFEVGYRSLIANHISVDLNYYRSNYTDFIITTRLVRPGNDVILPDGSTNLQAAREVFEGDAQSFIVSTNAHDKVSTQGATAALTYGHRGYLVSVSESWNRLDYRSADRNNVPAFNTPEYRTIITLRKKDILNVLGVSASWRWQSKFDWYGAFNDMRPGSVPAYSLADLAIFHEVSSKKIVVKIGGDNIFNRRIAQAYGSPAIGAMYYVSITLN